MAKQVRTLGFTESFAIGLGTMIAAGIFSLSGVAVAEIGSSATIAFFLAALIGGTTAAVYSSFASVYSESGGGYLFSSRTFENDTLVFIEGAMLFFGYSATTAFYLATMGEWVHEFIYPVSPWLVGAITAVLLGVLNARGTEESGLFQVVVTGAKVLVLLVFIAGAFAYQPPSETLGTFAGGFQWDLSGIAKIAAVAFITFFGFSAIAASAGEIIDPRKTVPKAIAASMVTVTLLYTLVIVAMVNSPIPAEVVAAQGETAMGKVAEAFLGPMGMWLIVAGAIFSMVSASNASILAASRIGYLMGREGRAFSRFHRIHREYGTPIWSVGACTTAIVGLIYLFTGLFHGDHAPLGLDLGLNALTGFANVNLLVPLSVVNAALIISHRKLKDFDPPFAVPLPYVIPVIGIVANLGLVASLPLDGIATGGVGIVTLMAVYLAFGGRLRAVEEMVTNVSDDGEQAASVPLADDDAEDGVRRVLVPVAREEDIARQLSLAEALEAPDAEAVHVDVIHIKEVPDQTPSDANDAEVDAEVERLESAVASLDLPDCFDISVEGYRSRSIGFAITHLARESESDLIVMGYPNKHHAVVDYVEHKTPCDVVYAFGLDAPVDLSVVTVGAGGGPNHAGLLEYLDRLGARGSDLHVIRVDPEFDGTPEQVQETVDGLPNTDNIEMHARTEKSVARGLVDGAKETGGVLFIGASRDHLLKTWVFGSTPDRAVDIAEEANVPVVIFRSRSTVTGTIEEAALIVSRAIRAVFP